MEDRSRPREDAGENTNTSLDNRETRQTRAREGLENILSRWRDVLSGDEEQRSREREETEEDDISTIETTPSQREGRLKGFFRSLMPKPERIPEESTTESQQYEHTEEPEYASLEHIKEGVVDDIEPAPDDTYEDDLADGPSGSEVVPDIEPTSTEPDEADTEDRDDPAIRRSHHTGPLPLVPTPIETRDVPIAAPDVLPAPVYSERKIGGAVAGLLAVDVLNYAAAKRRDNKNKAAAERAHRSLERKVDKLAKANENHDQRTRSLEAARNVRQPDDREKLVRKKEIKQVSLVDTQLPQNQEHARKLQETERPVVLPEVTRDAPFEIFERRHTGPEGVPPAKILEAVEAAAAKDVPLESMYERRHETRGAEDNTSIFGAAQTTGVPRTAGMSMGGSSSHHGQYTASTQKAQLSDKELEAEHKAAVQELYKKAAQTGSVIALILLMVYFIAVVLVRN